MSGTLEELLGALAAAGRGVDVSSLVDQIEALVDEDPEGSRAAVCAHARCACFSPIRTSRCGGSPPAASRD